MEPATSRSLKYTSTVQPVATCRHSPSPGPASPCVQAHQGQAECVYRPTSVNFYTVRYHGHMCMCKPAHLYRSASAPGWLTRKRVLTTPSWPRPARRFPRSPTVTDNLTILIVVQMRHHGRSGKFFFYRPIDCRYWHGPTDARKQTESGRTVFSSSCCLT